MDCREAQSLVTAYIKRQLDEKKTEEFIGHITHCEECYEELEIYFTIHFALKKLDEEQNVSYTMPYQQGMKHPGKQKIKKNSGTYHVRDKNSDSIVDMLLDNLESTERKLHRRKIFRICSYGIMLMAEIMLVLMLITQAQAWAGGGVRETFAYKALYGQEEAVSKK